MWEWDSQGGFRKFAEGIRFEELEIRTISDRIWNSAKIKIEMDG